MSDRAVPGVTWAVLVVLAVLLTVGGCLLFFRGSILPDGGYTNALPNGYSLVKTNDLTVAIFAPAGQEPQLHREGVAVAPLVKRIYVESDVIWGEVVASDESELSHLGTPGWFRLDTSTGQLSLFRSEQEMKSANPAVRFDWDVCP